MRIGVSVEFDISNYSDEDVQLSRDILSSWYNKLPKSFDIPAGNYEIECWTGAVKTHARCVVFDTLNAKAIGRFNSHNVRPMSQKLITENAFCPNGSSCN